eukprot:2557449-Karenia_brevis.AAC.1
MARKGILCNKAYGLQSRLKLFGATVSQSVLYGSGTWTMTLARERRLQSAQRRMMRLMLGSGRRVERQCAETQSDTTQSSDEQTKEEEMHLEIPEIWELEPWVDWVRRTTHLAEKEMQKAGVQDWVSQQRHRKWMLAGHISRRRDTR